jgi:cytochrome b involved in lipid metabolism
MASDTTRPSSSRTKVMLKPGFHLVDWMRLMQAMKVTPGKLRKISLRELAEHKSQFDCWTAYKGKVYNITQYLPYHPGGIPILMKAAGKDCTVLFNKYHSWVNAESMLSKCIVGVMMTEEEEGSLASTVGEPKETNGSSAKEEGEDVENTVPSHETARNEEASCDLSENIDPSVEVSFTKLDLSSTVNPAPLVPPASSIYNDGVKSTHLVLDALLDDKHKDEVDVQNSGSKDK